MNHNLKKNFIWNIIGSLVNALTSLLFLIIVTRINGIDKAGVFTFAFSTACLLYIIGIYSGRTYQVTETKEEISNYDYIYTRIITSSAIIIFALVFAIIKNYDIYKLSLIVILASFKAFEAFSDVIYGVMQKKDELYKTGISMFLKAVIGTLFFGLVDLITKNIIYASIALIFVYIVVFILYDLVNIKAYKLEKTNLDFKKVKYILKFGFFTFLFTFLTQYVINAPKYAIDNYLSNDIQTIYGIISMPATFMALVSVFLIQPFLNKFTTLSQENKIKEFIKLTLKLSIVLLFIGIFAIIVAYYVGIWFLELIYNVELKHQLIPLLLIIIGSVIYGITSILSNTLIVLRKTFFQSVIFLIVSFTSFISSEILIKKFSLVGAASSYLISMSILLILYIIMYIVVIRKRGSNG